MKIDRRAHFDDDSGRRIGPERREVAIPPLGLAASLAVPVAPRAVVVFAHGSGSSRLSPRNMGVAEELNRCGMATLLPELLLPGEVKDRRHVFDVKQLARRLADAVRWVALEPAFDGLPTGLVGAGTGAAAALAAAARTGLRIGAVVSRGGRPDLANGLLPHVSAPTLLIVGAADTGVVELNRWARERIGGSTSMELVPGATHLFSEPGAIEAVAALAAAWFERHLVVWPGGDAASTRPRLVPAAS